MDDILRGSYIDNSNPIRTGFISIEALPEDETNNLYAKIFFDDVMVQGPKLIQNTPWEKMGGPIGGLGYDIRIHPADKNIMFVTDNPSGIQKSADGGRTWRSSNTGVDVRTGASGEGIPNFSLTIDPNNPNTVWSGTQSVKGIFRSTDGGETWIRKDNGIEETNSISFRGFAIKPGDSNIVLAAAEITTMVLGEEFDKATGKIYRTTDGGEHWQTVWAGDSLARVLIFNPVDTNVVYCSTGIFDREAWNGIGIGILKSRDGGLSWSPINNGIDNLFVGFLEMHPTNPDILYAASGMNVLSYHGQLGGVYKTTNGGDSWAKLLGNDIFTIVVVSKSNPNIIYAGSGGAFYRSDDGGASWNKFYNQNESCWGPPGIRAGCPISAVVDPDNPYVVFANNYGGGAFKSTDGAQTWIDSSKGYTGATLWKVRSAQNKIYTIGRTGPFRSDDSGVTWNGILYSPASMAEWNDIVVNPQNNLEIIAADEHQGVILKSLDGGLSWRQVFRHPLVFASDPSNRHGFRTISYAPSDPSIVYAGSSKNRNILNGSSSVTKSFGMYKSADGGNTWASINNGLEATNLNILSLAVHPQDSSTIYAGTHQDGVYKSINGGSSWQAVNNGLASINVNSLAIDPFNPVTILAGLGEGAGIYRSENGGQSWQSSNSGILAECPSSLMKVGEARLGASFNSPLLLSQDNYSVPWSKVSSVVFDPINKSRVFATDETMGVYLSEDKGSTWTFINDGLSMRPSVPM